MKIILLMTMLLPLTALKAQTVVPSGFAAFTPGNRMANNMYTDSLSKKKWSFSRYSGISTSFTFFNGGNATIVSAPMGLQLNRRLNNNLYAFANITVAPAYVNFNHSFITTRSGKANPGSIFSGQNRLGVYSAASMGIMYINDDKTFSISGSISVERSSAPPLLLYPVNTPGSTPFNHPNR